MKDTILIIDDDVMNIKMVQQLLKDEYLVATASSGEIALKMLEQMRPDLILLDLRMPSMDGFEVLREIKKQESTLDIPVIILTAEQSTVVEAQTLKDGAVDFVSRPYSPAVLMNRIRHTLQMEHYKRHMENMVKEQASEIISHVERINRLQREVIISMANLIESRDGSTGEHVKRTGLYVELLVKNMSTQEKYRSVITRVYAEHLCNSAYMHDIGKITVSDTILQKPVRLTETEYEQMKEHAKSGGQIIRRIFEGIEDEDYIKMAEEVAELHHERWDGTGYPHGLKGEEIPLPARIMAVADVFDALISPRCYKKAMSLEEAYQVMQDMTGTYFDPEIMEVFCEHFDEICEISQRYQ